ncbi:6-phosphogluconate dehydrogenase C-terminal domain-like protein [Gymnopus androsaceus JB14]|uniref:6-phosphogluconate dehydrogenase C-terminal domain-like protein n=1 Tax=Gymnopus androsaceus JB14 TaxID=1447944 RepID=A0A6A4GYX0_9AGAR|nr:6-phosphogluconate dehydrogenase C-terminal domain-like protein [Gymnopus androsaceus JB14]
MSVAPMKEVLLDLEQLVLSVRTIAWTGFISLTLGKDSLIVKRSGLARVTAVARSNYDVVNRTGMHFKSQKYGEIPGWRPDRLCDSVESAADRPYDYVILTTKAIPDLVKTPTILAPLLTSPYIDKHPQPAYVLLQNGLNVEVDLYQAIKALGKDEPKIIGTSLFHWNESTRSRYTMIILLPSTLPKETAILDGIASILAKGGSTVSVVPEIQRKKFSKNFWNVAFSASATLTGYTLPSLFRAPPDNSSVKYEPYVAPKTANLINEHTLPTIKAIMEELISLANYLQGRALGFPDSEDGLPSSIVESTIANTAAIHVKPESTHVPSMLLDARKGQPIEVEVILGEVVRMAKDRGVPVPRIETLYGLLLVVQNQIIRKTTKL